MVNPAGGYGLGGYYAHQWDGYDYGFDPGTTSTKCRTHVPRSPHSALHYDMIDEDVF